LVLRRGHPVSFWALVGLLLGCARRSYAWAGDSVPIAIFCWFWRDFVFLRALAGRAIRDRLTLTSAEVLLPRNRLRGQFFNGSRRHRRQRVHRAVYGRRSATRSHLPSPSRSSPRLLSPGRTYVAAHDPSCVERILPTGAWMDILRQAVRFPSSAPSSGSPGWSRSLWRQLTAGVALHFSAARIAMFWPLAHALGDPRRRAAFDHGRLLPHPAPRECQAPGALPARLRPKTHQPVLPAWQTWSDGVQPRSRGQPSFGFTQCA